MNENVASQQEDQSCGTCGNSRSLFSIMKRHVSFLASCSYDTLKRSQVFKKRLGFPTEILPGQPFAGLLFETLSETEGNTLLRKESNMDQNR